MKAPTQRGKSEWKSGDSVTRVCVVNPNFYRSSGVTVAIRSIHRAVAEYPIEQHFVSCAYGDTDDDTNWMPPGRLKQFRLMSPNPLRLAFELCRFAGWLRRNGIDLVHVHHRRLAAILCPFRTFLGCRVIYTGNAMYPSSAWFRWLARPDSATGVSRSVSENMAETMRTRGVRVISNAVDFPKAFPERDGAFAVDAVCVARLEPVKGHSQLIEAWRILRDQGCAAKLALVGEGSLQDRLKAMVREHQLDGFVEFRGFRADVAFEFRRSRFNLLASQREGQGIVVIEAAACGLPSLLTDVDGLRDSLPPDRRLPNGLPFGDPEALASALKQWLDHPAEVRQEGQRFFEFLRGTSSAEVVGAEYARVYREIGSGEAM
jgi:glycosyltransferase involved in cell wall biosynthesis